MKTLKQIPIMHTGDFNLSTGPVTFTKRHLSSAVAAIADPSIKEPRLGVGHIDGRLDGEPAFGKFTNLNLQNDGHAVYGDLVGVPDWLAEVMPTSYPSRSVEGYFGYQGMTGSPLHDFALTRVVLLGVEMPGISTLEDLQVALTGEPEYTMLDEQEMLDAVSVFAVAAYIDGEPMKIKKRVEASINVDDVRREFYKQVSTGDRSNWWANEIQVDPQQVIVADEATGDTYRVPYAANASGKVEFSDPVSVEVVYADKLAASGHKPFQVGTGTVFATAAESRPEEGARMKRPKEVRAALGLAETATDEEVAEKRRKMLELLDVEDPETADDDETDENDEDEDTEDEETEETPAPPATPAPPTQAKRHVVKVPKRKKAVAAASSTVTVDREQFDTLQNTVQVLASGHAAAEKTRREGVVMAAIQAGKIPPARKDHWIAQIEADPAGIETVLASLAPVLPLRENVTGTSEHDVPDDDNMADPIFAAAVGSRPRSAEPRDMFVAAGQVVREG